MLDWAGHRKTFETAATSKSQIVCVRAHSSHAEWRAELPPSSCSQRHQSPSGPAPRRPPPPSHPTALSVSVSLPAPSAAAARVVAICSRLMWVTSSNWSICSSHPARILRLDTPASETLERRTSFCFWPLWLSQTLTRLFFFFFAATLHLRTPLQSDCVVSITATGPRLPENGSPQSSVIKEHNTFAVLFTNPNHAVFFCFAFFIFSLTWHSAAREHCSTTRHSWFQPYPPFWCFSHCYLTCMFSVFLSDIANHSFHKCHISFSIGMLPTDVVENSINYKWHHCGKSAHLHRAMPVQGFAPRRLKFPPFYRAQTLGHVSEKSRFGFKIAPCLKV